jgi:cyanophycinase
MSADPKGTVIIIGGHEDREGEMLILRKVAAHVKDGRLVITTVASHKPDGMYEIYAKIFHDFGVKTVDLEINSRAEAMEPGNVDKLNGCSAVFFTGGDQLKITSQIGDTPIFSRLREIFFTGGLVAGTSAGASVVCETMLVSGPSEESHRSSEGLKMAPGLGLFKDAIVDQHFSERGRFGRLVGAVAHNPRNLGVGLDEDTAIVIQKDKSLYVVGSGAVYLLDARFVKQSNIDDEEDNKTLSIFNITTHVLAQGDSFQLSERKPVAGSPEKIRKGLLNGSHRNGTKRRAKHRAA